MKKRYLSMKQFVSWRETPWPVDWPAIFGRRAPLVLEIGCGNGEMLARRAAAAPHNDFLAVDLQWPSVLRALRRVNQAGLDNARLTKGGADMVLTRLCAPGQLSHVYCLFPCPWPKRRHQVKRLFDAQFLRLMNSRMAPQADFRLVTDWRPFAQWVGEQALEAAFRPSLRLIGPEHDTKYERRWAQGGQSEFFELTLTKAEHLVLPPYEEPVLRTPLLARFDPARLAPFEDRGQAIASCREVFYDPLRDVALLRMVTAEDDFSQNFYVQVLRRPEGDWQVRVAPGCGVLPTVAVQEALDAVAARLAD